MTTDGHGRLKSGEMEERKCAYDKCDSYFECDKLSPKKYHSPRCSTLDAADKTAQQAKIKEAIRICKNQRCPQKAANGTCGSRLAREGILVYCTRADCDYSFNVKLPGSRSSFHQPIPEPTDKEGQRLGESEKETEDVEEEAGDGVDEPGVEGEEWVDDGDETEDAVPPVDLSVEAEDPERFLSEVGEGSGLYSDPTPEVTQQQLVLLLAKLDGDTLAKVILTAKRLHAVIHSLKDLS